MADMEIRIITGQIHLLSIRAFAEVAEPRMLIPAFHHQRAVFHIQVIEGISTVIEDGLSAVADGGAFCAAVSQNMLNTAVNQSGGRFCIFADKLKPVFINRGIRGFTVQSDILNAACHNLCINSCRSITPFCTGITIFNPLTVFPVPAVVCHQLLTIHHGILNRPGAHPLCTAGINCGVFGAGTVIDIDRLIAAVIDIVIQCQPGNCVIASCTGNVVIGGSAAVLCIGTAILNNGTLGFCIRITDRNVQFTAIDQAIFSISVIADSQLTVFIYTGIISGYPLFGVRGSAQLHHTESIHGSVIGSCTVRHLQVSDVFRINAFQRNTDNTAVIKRGCSE